MSLNLLSPMRMGKTTLTTHDANLFGDKEKVCGCCSKTFILSYTVNTNLYVYKVMVSNHIWAFFCGYTCWQKYNRELEAKIKQQQEETDRKKKKGATKYERR